MMILNYISRVIWLTLLLSVNGSKNYEFISNAFEKSPNLKYLSNVNVWMDNQIISLNDILGPDTAKWIMTGENANKVSRVAFTALSCCYSNTVVQIIKAGEYMTEQCLGGKYVLDGQSFDTCIGAIKDDLNTYETTLLDIMSSTLYYSEHLNIVIDKNVLKGLLATQMYFHNDDLYYPQTLATNVSENNLTRQKVSSYIRDTLESYTTEFCLPVTLDDCEIFTAVKNECYIFKKYFWDSTGLKHYIYCLATNLKHKLSGLKLPLSLSSTEKEYKRDLFYPKNFMLTMLLDLELIPGSSFSNSVRLRDVTLPSVIGLNTIQNIYQHIIKDYHSEGVFKYQTIVIECLSSVLFYLISNIIKADSTSGTLRLQQENSEEMIIIQNAIRTVQSLHPVGSYLYLNLKNIEYKRGLQMNDRHLLLESIEEYFEQVDFRTILLSLETVSEQTIVELLDNITKNIERVKHYFFTSIPVINERLDFTLEGVTGFMEPDFIFSHPEINSTTKTILCEFAEYAIQHFVLGDFVITQCEAIATELMVSFKNELSTELIKCFGEVQKLGQSIKTNFIHFSSKFLKSISFHDKSSLWANKIIEFMYNLLLYLSQDQQLHDVSENNNERILMYLLFTGTIFKKTLRLKRFHQTLIIPLEMFMNQYCPMPFSLEHYTSTIFHQFDINQQQSVMENDSLLFVHIGEKIFENQNDFSSKLLDYVGKNDDPFSHGTSNEVMENNDEESTNKKQCSVEDSTGWNNRTSCELMDVENNEEINSNENRFSEEFRRHDDFHNYLNLGYMMFEVIIREPLTSLNDFVFIKNYEVEWSNSYLTIPEIYNIAKNSMSTHNLVAYQIALFKVFNFALFGYIKEFLTAMQIPHLSFNNEVIEYFIGLIKDALSILEPILQKHHYKLINVIISNLENYKPSNSKLNQLIDIIEKYETESGVLRRVSNKEDGEVMKDDESLAEVAGILLMLSSRQVDRVQKERSPAFLNNSTDKKFINIIDNFRSFSKAMRNLYKQLCTVSNICLYLTYANQLF